MNRARDSGSAADGTPWHALPAAAVLQRLQVRRDGLSSAEAAARLQRHGPNVLPRRRRTGALVVFLRQFKSPLIYLLLAAAAVSAGIGELTDAAFIFVVLLSNALIGSVQEYRAESSALALDAMVSDTAVVWRDGVRQELASSALVPGDVVALASGDKVPADLRLLSDRELQVDESLLTGESTPVGKASDAELDPRTTLGDRRTMLHAGSTVLSGRAVGVVAATALATEVGAIAGALATGSEPPPPLILRLQQLARQIGLLMSLAIAAIAAAQLVQGVPLAEVFFVAVALAVAAIPEGLPVAITVALSIGTARMARRNVIVRSLPAVEGLGACTLVASDKTGTLTCNELTVRRLLLPDLAPVAVTGEGYRPEGGLADADGNEPRDARAEAAAHRLAVSTALCNEASLTLREDGVAHVGDTVDVAFLALAAKLGVDRGALSRSTPQVGVIPYEPHRRYAASFHHEPGGDFSVHVKGALEVILPMCADTDGAASRALQAQAEALAAEGYRVLAVAAGPVGEADAFAASPEGLRGLVLLGVAGLIDPVRPEVPDAVRQCAGAGIAVRMITGDHPSTALAIARELGIAETPDQVVTGRMLQAAAAGDGGGFAEQVARARVFARVEPLQKLDIVNALQGQGHTVAVTGDGVNDAPALRGADLGVAMGLHGTDVARGAADLILTDDNFASIVGGIEEGRVAYDNVRKVTLLLVATGMGEILLFCLALVAGLPVPLFAVQLLWLNLVTNGIQDVALAFERGEPGALARPPRPPEEPLFERRMVEQMVLGGTVIGLGGFAYFQAALAWGLSEAEARSALLLLMVLFENVHVFNCRSERRSAFRVPLAANPFVVLAAVGALALHVGAMYTPGLSTVLRIAPLHLGDALATVPVALLLVLALELYKRWRARGRRVGH